MNVGDLLASLLYEAGYEDMSKKIKDEMETDENTVLFMEPMVWSDDVAQAAGDEVESSYGIAINGISHEGMIMRLTVEE